MDKMNINGFSIEEIYALYTIVVGYERGKLKSFKNETEMLNEYGVLNEVKQIIKSVYCQEKKKEELIGIDEMKLNSEFYFTSRPSKMMGFLYHLRNSIAHAKIKKDGDEVYILDCESGKKSQYTAKGRFAYEIIEKMSNIMIQIKNETN